MKATHVIKNTGEKLAKMKVEFNVTLEYIEKAICHELYLEREITSKKQIVGQIQNLLYWDGENGMNTDCMNDLHNAETARPYVEKYFKDFL